MAQEYRDPSREADPHALPDIEVFHMTAQEAAWNTAAGTAAGWYWWSCLPGCLPDCDPVGPFDTEAEALADARQEV
jgi:hypothetical protein